MSCFSSCCTKSLLSNKGKVKKRKIFLFDLIVEHFHWLNRQLCSYELLLPCFMCLLFLSTGNGCHWRPVFYGWVELHEIDICNVKEAYPIYLLIRWKWRCFLKMLNLHMNTIEFMLSNLFEVLDLRTADPTLSLGDAGCRLNAIWKDFMMLYG